MNESAVVTPPPPRPKTFSAFYYLAAFAIPLVLVEAFVQIHNKPFRVPLGYDQHVDTVNLAMYIKPVIDGHWLGDVPELAAPFSANAFAHPVNANVDFALAWILGMAFGDYGRAVNFAWVIKIMAGGLTATFALRVMGISRATALIAGCLYSVMPYAFNRGVWNYNLSIYLVPMACMIACLLLKGRFSAQRRHVVWFSYLACALIGFNDPYVAFFTAFLFSVVLAILAFSTPRRPAIDALCLLGVLLISAGINSVPGLLARAADHEAAESHAAKHRTPAHIISYSLEPSTMLFPGLNHFIPQLRDLSARFKADGMAERGFQLGMFGSAGCLLLLSALLASPVAERLRPPVRAYIEETRPAVALTTALLLLSTVHGANIVIGVFFSSMIRHYERAVVFIGFFGFFATALLIDALFRRWAPSETRTGGPSFLRGITLTKRYGFLGVVLACGAIDQAGFTERQIFENWSRTADDFDEMAAFVREIEDRLPNDAMMHVPALGVVGSQAHLYGKPYLVSRTLRWSASHMATPTELMEWRSWQEHEINPAIRQQALLVAGFDGVWVDMDAKSENIERAIRIYGASPGTEILESRASNFRFIDLTVPRNRLREQLGPDAFERGRQAALARDAATLQQLLPKPRIPSRQSSQLP